MSVRAPGTEPVALEVLLGDLSIVEIPHDGGAEVLALLSEIHHANADLDKPYAPVGWSKCQGCGFRGACWPDAEARRDVSLVYGVDQGLARSLHDIGVTTSEQLVDRFSVDALAGFVRPWGTKQRHVGKSAAQILDQATAMVQGREIRRARPRIPESDNYVMFDLEGMPPSSIPPT